MQFPCIFNIEELTQHRRWTLSSADSTFSHSLRIYVWFFYLCHITYVPHDQNLIELIILNPFHQSFIGYQSEKYMSLIEIRAVGNLKLNLSLFSWQLTYYGFVSFFGNPVLENSKHPGIQSKYNLTRPFDSFSEGKPYRKWAQREST